MGVAGENAPVGLTYHFLKWGMVHSTQLICSLPLNTMQVWDVRPQQHICT